MADETTPVTPATPQVNVSPDVNVTPDSLAMSASKYRTELLKMPMLALGPVLNYFTIRSGIRHSEAVGELSGNIEMGPYDPYRVDKEGMSVNGRVLYTYFGSVIKQFHPNSVVKSIYGSSITKGEGLASIPITLQVLSYLAAKLGKGFALHLFDAVRDEKGTKTADLFNGLDTITASEITSGGISVAKGNLYEFESKIDSTNAVDQITDFCRSASDELLGYEDGYDAKGGGLNLLVPRTVLYAYRDDYKSTTGHVPYYDKFNQTTVEGFDNIKLVPIAGKAKSDYIQLSTKGNLLIGCDQMGGVENITVEKHHPFILDFIAAMFFGTDYESVNAERLLVGKLKSGS